MKLIEVWSEGTVSIAVAIAVGSIKGHEQNAPLKIQKGGDTQMQVSVISRPYHSLEMGKHNVVCCIPRMAALRATSSMRTPPYRAEILVDSVPSVA